MAALLRAPTKFILLNPCSEFAMQEPCPQELSIAERGSEWVEDDIEDFTENFSKVQPHGGTPLVDHLERIFQSLQHIESKIVLVVATDGKPTDSFGYTSPQVDRDFENALRRVQSKAFVVIRLCTNDDNVLKYYQQLDEKEEFNLEVLDDYTDEAREVHSYNPWLSYSLSLHRCREMGMSCHGMFRFLDWLDERSLSREEIVHALTVLGVAPEGSSENGEKSALFHEDEEWRSFCTLVDQQQRSSHEELQEKGVHFQGFYPWNPIHKRTTFLIDVLSLKRHGTRRALLFLASGSWAMLLVAIVAMLVKLLWGKC
ncbi:hypothetical protein IV203_009332 [Nitzschia inconspicua]|uniref:VWFA domain-containing protein n=1 Tax=Nitzschia inconspicua TaxID=303405 RepID=A0A9K3L1M3_9STRA|nr:hypothetical protein IV203_009332 [Nitzschia inconspicua]